jgi:hypothetical protein
VQVAAKAAASSHGEGPVLPISSEITVSGAARHFLEQIVAGDVAETGVDGLEPVEVDRQYPIQAAMS